MSASETASLSRPIFAALDLSSVRGMSALLGVLALCVTTGCGQNALGDPTGSTCPSDSKLTYDNFGKAFFATNCNSCHAAKQAPHFSTQEDIQFFRDDIDRAAASGPGNTNTYMPDEGDVSDADREKLGEWLACGAP